jgi:hypothetical protein
MALGVGLALSAAGCTSTSVKPSGTSEQSPGASTRAESPPLSPSPSVTRLGLKLPHVQAWRPNPGDIEPEVKLRAVRVIEAIGSWSAGAGMAAAESRVAALGETGRLARQAPSLLHAARRAVVEVIDAQYGGILPDTASVLVPCRQWWTSGDALDRGGTTVDVRLRKAGIHWRVTAIHPAQPGRPVKLSSLAQRVLKSDGIDLPPDAVADVRSGLVHDSVLNTLLTLARDYSIGVSVIRSGHPTYVFGTNRLSDHPRGRAFDTWRINGHAVVDPATPKKLITGYMEAAAAAGSYNVGGPYQLAGSGNKFFSDATHHDHVHAGFLH